jgi:aryl-alcohol dehydrogenase-like predicted oxidoreductase
MQYQRLGRSDLEVSRVALGCWAISTKDFFWDHQAREDSVAAIHASLDAGVTFFDTAPAYGNGESEEILGQALGPNRPKVVVATKVPPTHLEPALLRQSCEASLRAVGTDYIDLYQVHWPNPKLPWEPTYRTLEALKAEGKIRALGVSNFGVSFLDEVRRAGPVESNQLPYSLLWRPIEFEILPRCVEQEIGVLCYSPLCQGLLTGKFRVPDEVPDKRARSRLFSAQRAMTRHGEPGCQDQAFAALRDLATIAAELGQPLGRISMAWLLCQPGVTAVVAGARNAEQALENARAAELALDADVVQRLGCVTETVKNLLGPNADPWEHVSRMERP